MNTLLSTLEQELRDTGALSDETCRAFAQADDSVKHGFEPSLRFLGCAIESAAVAGEGVPATRRLQAIRFMLLRLGAHTNTPRWSSRVLDDLVDAALGPPGGTIGEIVRALFALLSETPSGLADLQANFIREIAINVVGRHRRAYSSEDFSWLASALVNPSAKPTPAQAYLAAYTLPVSLTPQCRDVIVRALHSTRFEHEVTQQLAD